MDDLKSPEGSAYGDDQHVRTLDYLGLAEETPMGSGAFDGLSEASMGLSGASSSDHLPPSSLAPPSASAMHRMGSAGSIVQPANPFAEVSLQHSRLRSNTVAAFGRPSPSSSSTSEAFFRPNHPTQHGGYSHHTPSVSLSSASYPTSTLSGPDEMQHSSNGHYHQHPQQHRSTPSGDSGRLLYATATSSALPSPDEHGTPPSLSLHPSNGIGGGGAGGDTNGHSDHFLPNRGRAATIGILDGDKDLFGAQRRRAGTTVGIPPRHLGVGATSGMSGVGGGVGGSDGGGGPAASMANRMGRLSISEDQARFSLLLSLSSYSS